MSSDTVACVSVVGNLLAHSVWQHGLISMWLTPRYDSLYKHATRGPLLTY